MGTLEDFLSMEVRLKRRSYFRNGGQCSFGGEGIGGWG